MTVMTGHDYREFRFRKRTHRDQYLGPFINHEMNRCIACYRCVRFYRDYAGGRDFDVFAAHDHVYFGRHMDGVLENEFSGNLIEVCPTGVFTDKTFKRHFTRKWDLQTAPSICAHCGVGCNTIPGERYGLLRRIRNRYNHEVNGYFLCDRGRGGYEFVNSERRLRQVLLRPTPGEPLRPIGKDEALRYAATLLMDKTKVIGIGSPRASLESNFALRALVGPGRFHRGVSARDSQLAKTALQILQHGPARSPSLHDVELADAVLVLGEDLTNTAPMLALAVRQAVRQQPMQRAAKMKIPAWHDYAVRELVQDQKGPCYLATPAATKLDDVATKVYHAAPDDLARLGFAVAHVLDAQAPAVTDLPDEIKALAGAIALALKSAERPMIVSGTSCGSEVMLHAAANVAWALCRNGRPAELCFTVPECNTLGLTLMGGGDLETAFEAVQRGKAETVIILENDLFRRTEAAAINSFLSGAAHVIALDYLANGTTENAELVFPAATFAEASGTQVNNEGRAQRFYEVFVPPGDLQASWRWLRDLMGAPWQTLDDITTALTEALPVFRSISQIAPPAGFRIAGQKIPREPHRYSGRTAMHANISVHEPKPPDDPDSPLAYSMEGLEGIPPSPLMARFWEPGWNSVQAVNKFQEEVGGPLKGGDPGRRLIEASPEAKGDYFPAIPAAFQRRDGEWLLIPAHHIFGSEELSALAPGVAQLAPKPYLAMHPEDAAGLRVVEGETIMLAVGQATYRLPLKPSVSLARGTAALPIGLPGVSVPDLPAWGRISKESN
jgi:NADH-quinone oxidoreductase subunit G